MWRKLNKTFAIMAVLSMLVVLLAACGGPAATAVPPTNTVPAGGTEPTAMTEEPTAMTEEPTAMATGEATAMSGEPTKTGGGAMGMPENCSAVELTYWTPFTGPDGPFMQTIVNNFNSANQNIKVTMNTVPGGEYSTQLGTAAASDTLPDVAIINEDQVATQAFRGVLRPLGDAANQIGYSAADFPKVAWNAGTVAGKQYALPLSFVAMTQYYNQDMLTAAGIDKAPTTRAEFEAAAAAMTKDGKYGFLLTNGFPIQQIFQQLLHQYGGSEFSADGTTATWNSEAGVKALTWMKEAQTKYGQANLEVDAELNAFKAGGVGLIWNGIWQIPNVTGEAVEFKGMAGPVPQIGDQPAVWAGGPLLALPAKKNPDACKDAAAGMFIKYVLDNSLEWAKAGSIPAANKVRESAEFKALPHSAIGPSVANPVFPPSIPGIGDAFLPLGEAVGSIMSGTETDIKKALDSSAERANTILKENKATYGDAPKTP